MPTRPHEPPGESPTQLVYDDRQPVLLLRESVLRVAEGPDAGASCTMALRRASVGTSRDNTLVLTDPRVSRRHLELQIHDRGYLLLDLGSTNGTFVGGTRVREAVLAIGAEVRLGSTVLRLEKGTTRSEAISAKRAFGVLIGSSPAMQEVYGILSAVAPTDATVLILGETGTGKELVAEELHRKSPRRDGLLCVVDCGALPPSLIESELFGHERGAFTGAVSTREGVFERARGGTVFLDELGELPLELQTRLLRVLDQRTIKRVGGDLPRKVDIRLVAATNRDLAADVRAGTFRRDLYYRLAVVKLVLPTLRERRQDIPLLARHFLWQAGCADPDSVLTPDVLETLRSRKWPGNVRELRNVVERAMILSGGAQAMGEPDELDEPDELEAAGELEELEELEPEDSEPEAPGSPPATRPSREDPPGPDAIDWFVGAMPATFLQLPYKDAKEHLVQRFEALYMRRLFECHGNNISRIAEEAKIDRHLVRKLLRKHALQEKP